MEGQAHLDSGSKRFPFQAQVSSRTQGLVGNLYTNAAGPVADRVAVFMRTSECPASRSTWPKRMKSALCPPILSQPLLGSTPPSACLVQSPGQEHAGLGDGAGRFAGLCYLQGRKGSLAGGVCSGHLSSRLQLSLNRTKQGATGKEVFREGAIS